MFASLQSYLFGPSEDALNIQPSSLIFKLLPSDQQILCIYLIKIPRFILDLPGTDPGFLERGFICIKLWGSLY